jgi:hypothetical protein
MKSERTRERDRVRSIESVMGGWWRGSEDLRYMPPCTLSGDDIREKVLGCPLDDETAIVERMKRMRSLFSAGALDDRTWCILSIAASRALDALDAKQRASNLATYRKQN